MKRRTFLTNLAATAALPMIPVKALAGMAPTAAAASMDQPYLWASFITRVHNNASPAMLQRLLKLDPSVATRVYSELVKNNVVTPPNAYGISRAVNPFPQPGMAHMQGQTGANSITGSKKSAKLDTSKVTKTDERRAEPSDDSPPVNQDVAASQDEHIVNDSTEPTPDTDRQA